MNMRDGSTRGLLVAILLLSLPALAYEGSSTVNFNVTGTIEAPSCEVAVEPSNSIDLGTVSSLGPGDQYLYTFGDDADIHTFNMVARMFSPYGQVRSGMVGFTATFDVAYK